ncbi:hypothetical protein ABZ593_21035 [Streptomyces sp. NPDC012617]|uniref:hypothetical protein n=1 Tax=Streptomyces TaxID=1883 RepID=UPI0033F1B7F9
MSTPPKTPTVVIARVLRSLGLTQGGDFRVTGDYRNGERIGTYVLPLTRHADETITANADEIERLAAESPFPFRVSVRYPSGDRPMTTVANYGSRVRDEAPATEEAPADPAPASEGTPETEPDPDPEIPADGSPSAGYFKGARVRAWGQRRADALGWSPRQAHLVAMAGTAGLSYDKAGVLRDRPRPGWAGTAVDEARLTPLVKAGFISVTEPYVPGHKQVGLTVDGVQALFLWRVYRPAPAVKDRREEREPLRPLIGGEYAARRDQAAAEDRRRREAERAALYAALEEMHAWEAWEDTRWKVWSTIHGITHRLGRRVPPGWMPTAEEIEEHRLAPDLVASLHADALRPRPKPRLPKSAPARPLDVIPLPAVPAEIEQLGLFAEAS